MKKPVRQIKATNNYLTQKSRISKRINNFPMFFAFNQEQFDEGLKKLGVTKEELVSLGAGGFIRKRDKEAYLDMINKSDKEHQDMMRDKQYVYNMFRYELANHEYCITRDYSDTLGSLGLTMKDVMKSPLLKTQLEKATHDYLRDCNE